MNLREWALVAFTLLMQTSVGIVLIVGALYPLVARTSPVAAGRAFDVSLLVAGICAALGLVTSLAHLGHPLHAWLAVSNVRASWLSREVGSAVLFTLAAGGVVLAFRAGAASAAVRTAASLVAVLLGGALLYAMARIYMVPAQEAWNRVATPVSFFATALLLGAIVVLVTFGVAAIGSPALKGAADAAALASLSRVLVAVAVVLVVLQVLLLPAQLAAVIREPAAAISVAAGSHAAAWLSAARALLALGAVVLLVNAARALPGTWPVTVALVALFLLLLSEILGRLLFYASSVRI